LEEPFYPWLLRFVFRPSLATEMFVVVTQVLCIAKCLARLNVEIGKCDDAIHYHPVFWLMVLLTAAFSAVESMYLQDVCSVSGQYGHQQQGRSRTGRNRATFGFFRSFSSQLLAPLLESGDAAGDVEHDENHAANADGDNTPNTDENDENVRATSDITADTSYKAKWTDLLTMCYQDGLMITAAFVFLLLAAVAQVLIPKYLGNILDALAAAFGNPDDQSHHHCENGMWDVPHFMSNVKLLVIASIAAGVFSGLRGSIFVSVYSRLCLMRHGKYYENSV
jgi:hypothetical protein